MSPTEKIRIVESISYLQEFKNWGIGVEMDNSSEVLKQSSLPYGLGNWIILQEDTSLPPEGVSVPFKSPEVSKVQSNIGGEILDTGISCGSAVLTGIVAGTGALAAPETVGASLAMTYLAWSAAGASALQCGVGIGRVINEIASPGSNAVLDDSIVYKTIMYTADAVQIANDVPAVAKSFKYYLKLEKVAGEERSVLTLLRSMNKQARRQITFELSEAVSKKQFKRMVEAGEFVSVLTAKQIQWSSIHRMMETVGSALDTVSSARGGNIQYLVKLVDEKKD